MGHGLPNFIAIRYEDGSYASYSTEPTTLQGFVGCKEVNVFSPLTKIEVETGKVDSKHVHLRFCYNNRYLTRVGAGTDDVWLVATSDRKEEDRSKWSCTLFEPIINDHEDDGNSSSSSFHLIHVQSGKYARVNLQSNYKDFAPNCLYVGDQPPGHIFGYVDWDSIVMLPKHVTFIGFDCEHYLKSCCIDGDECLIFSSIEGNEEATAYEITMNPDGYLRIKSRKSGSYWRVAEHEDYDWMRADAGEDDGALFWPVKVDDKTLALQAAGSKQFCKRLTAGNYTSGLAAAVSTITLETKLIVEELVLERQINDITYHVDRARIYNQKTVVLGEGSAANHTQERATLTIRVSYEDIRTYCYRNSSVLKLGVESSPIKAGIPFISDGSIEVSAEVSSSSLGWNTETTQRIKREATHEVFMSPMSSVRVRYVATEGKCDVPFSYTQRDKLSRDGSSITTIHIDGIFTGVNYYSFRFEPVYAT